jgi:hypothetical protein
MDRGGDEMIMIGHEAAMRAVISFADVLEDVQKGFLKG